MRLLARSWARTALFLIFYYVFIKHSSWCRHGDLLSWQKSLYVEGRSADIKVNLLTVMPRVRGQMRFAWSSKKVNGFRVAFVKFWEKGNNLRLSKSSPSCPVILFSSFESAVRSEEHTATLGLLILPHQMVACTSCGCLMDRCVDWLVHSVVHWKILTMTIKGQVENRGQVKDIRSAGNVS